MFQVPKNHQDHINPRPKTAKPPNKQLRHRKQKSPL